MDRDPDRRNSSSSAAWNTRRACRTPSQHSPRIRRSHPGTTLAIAGEGTQFTWLYQQARTHRVARAVDFLGNLDHTELLSWLHGADAIVLPSRYEPFGIIALEAAAAGTPLITSTAGGLGEAVVDGVTGMSFPTGRHRRAHLGCPRGTRRSRRGTGTGGGRPRTPDIGLRLASGRRGDCSRLRGREASGATAVGPVHRSPSVRCPVAELALC